MENNFVEILTKAIKDLHEMNLECAKEFNEPYSEQFPASLTRVVEIDGKKYGISLEIKIREL